MAGGAPQLERLSLRVHRLSRLRAHRFEGWRDPPPAWRAGVGFAKEHRPPCAATPPRLALSGRFGAERGIRVQAALHGAVRRGNSARISLKLSEG